LAVHRTLAQYCQTCDDGRFAEFGECFLDDAEVVFGERVVRGRAAITDWIAAAMPAERRGKHLCMNPLVEVDGDRARAATDFVFLARGDSGPRISAAGRYVDELRADGDRWRFARREIVLLSGRSAQA
jgi:3-phenylpropionate/cinnamic acid dioxygenase small subunit